MKKVKTIEGKPLKRIEGKIHSKSARLRLRLSRTGGLNAAVHPARGLTFNTKHGVRISKTFRGLTLGIQNGRGIFRGRWSAADGALNTNLSRSGLSFSTSTKHGTYNWTRPNRSSFKFAGIQVRGKKAAGPALILAIFAIIPALLSLAFQLLQFAGFLILMGIRVSLWLLAAMLQVVILLLNVTLFLIWDLPIQIMNLIAGKTIVDVTVDTSNDEGELVETGSGEAASSPSESKLSVVDSEIEDLELRISNLTGGRPAPSRLRTIAMLCAFPVGVSLGITGLWTLLFVVNSYIQKGMTNGELLFLAGLSLVLSGVSYLMIRPGYRHVMVYLAKRKLAMLEGFSLKKGDSSL